MKTRKRKKYSAFRNQPIQLRSSHVNLRVRFNDSYVKRCKFD